MVCCHALLSCYVVTLSSAFAVFSSIRFGKQHKKSLRDLRIPFYRIMQLLTRLARREVNTNHGIREELWLWLWFTKLWTRSFCGIITAFVRFLDAFSRYANARSFCIYISITMKCERLQGWQVVLLSEPKRNQNMKIIFSLTDV